MHIANPIYDVVFKFLMEDSRIAKLILSTIIGEEIIELRFLPQEYISDNDSSKDNEFRGKIPLNSLTFYRLDFSAKIQTPDGFKQVIIELQKAKYPTDIIRFRQYLGGQLRNIENTHLVNIKGKARRVGIPIISIYFLGHKLDYTTASAIKISRTYQDMMTGKEITTKEPFIESLTLDSYVIQIPYLSDKRRNDLEILLQVFDQSQAINSLAHILNINDDEFPSKYRPIIRKLQKAVLSNELKKKMTIEDTIFIDLADRERIIYDLELKIKISEQKLEQFQENIIQEKVNIRLEAEKENERIRLEAERENEILRITAEEEKRVNEKLMLEIERLKNLNL